MKFSLTGRSRVLAALASAALLAAGGGVAMAAEGDPATDITVRAGDQLGPVSRQILGANQLAVYNAYGLFDPATNQLAPDFMSKLRQSGITTLRFPGGTAANMYHWKDAIGPQAQRGCQATWAWNIPSGSEYGPDEHMRVVEELNGATSVVVNFATGTAAEAADFVEYLNAPVDSNPNDGVPWAKVRAANGHPEPYNVTWFEVANEINYPDQTYWVGTGLTDSERATKYTFGGETSFTNQRLIDDCDRRPAAAVVAADREQKFAVAYAPVKHGTDRVKVAGAAWTRVDSVKLAGPTDKVYEINDTTGRITFGDGVNGAKPPVGAVLTADYVSGEHDGFVDFYQLMKQADPNIKVCSSFRSATWIQMMGSQHPYDCFIHHKYSATTARPSLEQWHDQAMRAADQSGESWASWEQTIADNGGHAADGSRPVVLATEYGLADFQNKAPFADYLGSLDQGLHEATMLSFFVQHGTPLAAKHLLFGTCSGYGPPGVPKFNPAMAVIGCPSGFLSSATALTFELYSSNLGSQAVASAITDNPRVGTVTSTLNDTYDALVVTATRADDGSLRVIVINRARQDVASTLTLDGFTAAGPVAVTTLNGTSTYAVNRADDPNAVSLTRQSIELGSSYTFPAHSVTAFVVNPA